MPSMNAEQKIALVTGANRGIGLEISRQLSENGIFTLMGSRDITKGEKSLKQHSLKGASAVKLDITDESDVENILKTVRSDYGKLDILVNNGAILIDDTDFPSKTDLETAKKTFETNLFGTWRMCQTFIPLMKKNNYGRIVNVSSGAGSLSSLSEELYSPAYSISKASLNALTMTLARELKSANILVNAMSPGWVRTDMGGKSAPRSVQEGADTALWLATLPDNGPSGGFFEDRKRIDW